MFKLEKSRIAIVTLIGLLATGLAACGGGGGGSDSSGGGSGGGGTTTTITGTGAAPNTGPGDTQNYFPHATGDTWSYDVTNTDPQALLPSAIATNTVTGMTTTRGLNATVFSLNDPTYATTPVDNYFAVSAGGVTNAGNSDSTDVLGNQIVPFVSLLFPASTGTQSSVRGTNVPAGTTDDGTAITANLTQAITNASVTDTVDTAIGTYTNAIKQVTTISGTAMAGTQTVDITGTTTSWLAPGAGLVKEISTGSVQGTAFTQTFGVRSYNVGGVPHGLGSVATLSADIDPAGGAQYRPAVASDGTNFLVVTTASVSQVGTGQLERYFEGRIVRPDGTVISAFPVSPPLTAGSSQPVTLHEAVAAFDGANYLVVYDQWDQTPGNDESVWAVQVSPTGTVTVLNASPLIQPYQPWNSPHSIALAFDGTQFLLVYEANQILYGQFISPSTHQFSGSAVVLDSNDLPGYPAVAFNGANYLVAWDALMAAGAVDAGTYSALVSPAGTVSAHVPLYYPATPGIENAGHPSVASDGNQFMVSYLDARNAGMAVPRDYRISATRVSSTGSILDGTAAAPGIVITDTTDISAWPTAATFYAGMFRVLWGQYGAYISDVVLTGGSVSSAGRVGNNGTLGFPITTIANSSDWMAWNIGSNSHGALMVWLTDGFPRVLQCMPIFPP